jgi:hypothetical protein
MMMMMIMMMMMMMMMMIIIIIIIIIKKITAFQRHKVCRERGVKIHSFLGSELRGFVCSQIYAPAALRP